VKKKQKALLVAATMIFDIVIVACLIFQNKNYYLIEQGNGAKRGNQVVNSNTEDKVSFLEITNSNEVDNTINSVLIAAEEEIVREEVYENMTIEELSEKIERSLNSDIAGKGELIATYSIEKGVDPYLATAIMLHETGCKWTCSSLVKKCNNVGGQIGKGCNGYKYYETLDEGIRGFIDNIYKNYVAYGLLTPEEMNPKYAASPAWAGKVNSYIEQIRNN